MLVDLVMFFFFNENKIMINEMSFPVFIKTLTMSIYLKII